MLYLNELYLPTQHPSQQLFVEVEIAGVLHLPSLKCTIWRTIDNDHVNTHDVVQIDPKCQLLTKR